jgi:Amiloride-sensitive sodium channel
MTATQKKKGNLRKDLKTSVWEETSIRKQVDGFLGSVTLDGVHWIVDSSKWMVKQFWIVITVSALVLSSYFSWRVSCTYLYDSSFVVDYSVDNVNVSETGPVQFPEFVICLEAPWDVLKSQELNMSLDLLSYMTNLFYPYGGLGKDSSLYENSKILAQLESEYRQLLTTTGLNTIEILDKITVSCEQILDFCNFGYISFVSGETCCMLLFGNPEYGMKGKCFRTSNKNLNFALKDAGALSGLAIKFTIPNDVINRLNYDIVNYPASLSNGVSFVASNRQNHLYTVVPKVKSLVPNALNAISLKKITVDRSKKHSPFGSYSCIKDDDLISYAHLTPGYAAYTREHCIIAEKQKSVVNTFNCSLFYFAAIPGTEYCGPTETTTIYFER